MAENDKGKSIETNDNEVDDSDSDRDPTPPPLPYNPPPVSATVETTKRSRAKSFMGRPAPPPPGTANVVFHAPAPPKTAPPRSLSSLRESDAQKAVAAVKAAKAVVTREAPPVPIDDED